LAALVLVPGCGTDREPGSLFGPSQAGVPVIEARLVVGRGFPPVRVTETLAPDEVYTLERAAVPGASVRIEGLAGAVAYREAGEGAPGIYVPETADGRVEPETVYTLRVEMPDGRRVTARTETPPVLEVDRWVQTEPDGTVRRELETYAEAGEAIYERNRVVHQDGQIEALLAGPLDRLHVGIFSLDPDSGFVIDVSFLDEEDLDEFTRATSSPAISSTDARLTLPWLAIFFTGRYRLEIYSIDQNWFDLLLSVPEFSGGPGFGGNAGDNFEVPLFHVDGGIGLFGSASVDSVGFFVERPPQAKAAPPEAERP
jgi:hypothetical protein